MMIITVVPGVVTPGTVMVVAHGVAIRVMVTEAIPVMVAIPAMAGEVTPVMVAILAMAGEVIPVMAAMEVTPVTAAGSSSCSHKQKPAHKAGFCRYGISVEILTGSLIMDI